MKASVQHVPAQPILARILQSRLPCQYLGEGNATALVCESALVRAHFRLKSANGHIKMVAAQCLKPALGQGWQRAGRAVDQLPTRMHSSVSGATMCSNMKTYLRMLRHVLLQWLCANVQGGGNPGKGLNLLLLPLRLPRCHQVSRCRSQSRPLHHRNPARR